jgi:3'-phosphoadenosine 5'-phosphosulfate sulfotransferase (PAPS reductase)/FAD synthetase
MTSIQTIRTNTKQLATLRKQAKEESTAGNLAATNETLQKIHDLKAAIGTDTIDRAEYLLHQTDAAIVVCFSGGKDSVAMVLDLINRGIDMSRVVLMHHLVDGKGGNIWDWKGTDSYCEAFAKAFGLPLLYSFRAGGIQREINRKNEGLQDVFYQAEEGGEFIKVAANAGSSTRGKFPAIAADLASRWCSSVVKIDVCKTVIRKMFAKDAQVLVLTGERREESANRAKYLKAELHATDSPKFNREVIQFRAVIDWPEQQVWDEMKAHGVVAHPAYFCGWSRCSCQTYIFNGPDVFATIAKYDESKIMNIAMTEEKLGFTLKRKTDIIEFAAKGTPMNVDAFWWKQATEEFTTPVLVPSSVWQLPVGAFAEGQACGAL